ncbi:MAG: hypothetical protein L7T84_02820 [Akkermansiaceae bacterium]|nr:hypothetical protein [Akkermansiaceae bacterium]
MESRPSLCARLVNTETKKVLLKSGGARGPQIKRTTWELSKFKGKTVSLQIVDQHNEDWGRLTFADFSVEGQLLKD